MNPSTSTVLAKAISARRAAEPEPSIQRGATREFPTSVVMIRKLMWLYIVLWITEGALRKWIVPGLATPLLIIRDPVLLFMFYLAIKEGIFPNGFLVTSIFVLGIIAFLVSTAFTNTTMFIQLYGLRASYMHLLLVFLIPKVFNRDDVIQVGKWTLLAAGPMAALVALQFLAGKSSWLNAGAGGVTNSMLDAAYGHIRPSGTFSFTNGLSGFTAISAVFFLYHLLEKRVYPRQIWLAAAPSVLVLIVLSGSRTAAGIVFLIMATVAFISIFERRYRAATVKLGALIGLLVLVVGSFAVFKQGLEVFAYRFGNAANVRTGFVGRFFEGFQAPFIIAEQAPTFGWGLGMGTNVAAGLMFGYGVITLSEGELGRNIMESGPLLGGVYLVLRASISLYIGARALGSLRRDGNPLPLLLYSGCCIDMIQGQFSQPTELGYATIACGLCLAAIRLEANPVPAEEPVIVPSKRPAPAARGTDRRPEPVRPLPVPAKHSVAPAAPAGSQPAAMRGRSAYADRLHRDAPVSPPENLPEPPI